jgi:hypothetical protein
MPLTTYGATQAAKLLFTNEAPAEPAAWYVALHTADPGVTGGTAEVTGSAYARQGSIALTRTNGVCKNTGVPITFPTVATTGYTVTHASIWDAASAGNCLLTGALAVAKVLAVGEALSFASDELILTLV